MPRGSITDQDVDFVETWENVAPYQNAIVRLDTRGDEKPEIITGRRQFLLTTQERMITEGKIVDAKNNPFRNGAFRPVMVPDSVTIESNPNALADEDIIKIFTSSDLAWSEWLSSIDSVATLRRMLDLADEESADLTLKRYRQIEDRLVEVRGRPNVATSDPDLKRFLSNQPSGGGRDVATSGAANPRRQGGRSSDYR